MSVPKPIHDTGFGVHDDTNCYWKPPDLPGYARWLKEHGVSWYLLFVGDENKADYCKALVDADIEPIVRFWPAKMPNMRIDQGHVDAYLAAGARWFVLGNEFNLNEEWETTRPADGPEICARKYAAEAAIIQEKGGYPMTPPPSLGGHVLHRVWFRRFLQELKNIGFNPEPGGIGLHCRSVGNPLEDGPEDYDCSAREWEWFDATIKEIYGRELYMANLEAFDEPNWSKRLHPEFSPQQKWDWWYRRNIEQIRWFDPNNDGYRYPSRVLCNTFWVIHCGGTWNDCGLVDNFYYNDETGDGTETKLWRDLPSIITWARDGVEPPPPPPPPPPVDLELHVFDVNGHEQTLDWAVQKYGIRVGQIDAEALHLVEIREHSGPASLDVYVRGRDGSPLPNVNVDFHWPDGLGSQLTDPYGKAGFAYGPGAWIKDPAVGGPHWIEFPEMLHDDVGGLGMLAGTEHDHLDLKFQYGGGEPLPPPDPYSLKRRLEGAPHGFNDARAAVEALSRMGELEAESLAAGRIDANGAPLFGNIETIIVHHTVGEIDSMEAFAKWAVNTKGWPTVPYHFVVTRDATIYWIAKLKYLTHHAGSFNDISVAIAFEGDYTSEYPSDAMVESGQYLLASLYEFFGQGWGAFRLIGLIPHRWIANKPCPGTIWRLLIWRPWPVLEIPEE